jgi:hypothetical protein
MVQALRTARLGFGSSSPNSKRIMKSRQASGFRSSAVTTGAHSSAVTPYCWKDVHDFLLFGVRLFDDLLFLAPALIKEVLGVTPGRQVAAQPHRDGTGGNFRQPGRDDNVRGGQRAGDARGQRERHRQPIRHANHHVADGVAAGEMLFDVLHGS